MNLLEILASGAFILWFSIIASIVTIVSLEFRREGWATTFISLAIGVVVWNYGWDAWAFIKDNIGTSVLFLVGYLALGVAWSFLKWNEFVRDVFDKYKEVYADFIKTYKEFNDMTKGELINKVNSRCGSKIYHSEVKVLDDVINGVTPEGVNNKASITAWITYWPLSVIGTLLNNPLKKLVGWIYNQVSGIYDEISLRHRAKLIK